MKLIGYTCVYNEEKMIPYVMPYVERMGYDKFIVWDNMSTDRTVELLSKYPFVETRTYDTGGKFDDNTKRDKEIEGYVECYAMANVGTPEEEQIWMTFTDFDEVIFFPSEKKRFKYYLEWGYNREGYNCFFEQMVNLLPPENCDGDLYEVMKLDENTLIHTVEGVKGTWWYGDGAKPTMFCVNDFAYMAFVPGNHYALCKTDKEIKNIAAKNEITPFHLKFIDKLNLKKRYKEYNERSLVSYGDIVPEIDEHYNNVLYGASFPLENYFLIKGFKNNSYNLDKEYGLKLDV